MNKTLEAFNKIKNTTYWDDVPTEYFPEECLLIEKELKRLEEIDNAMFLNNKKLKTLEIITNIPDNYKEGLLYTFQHLLVARKITQEEYDLLKEVLENEHDS